MKHYLSSGIAASLLLGSASFAFAASELTIESWRNDDLSIWQETILPAFMKAHPEVKIRFSPTAPTQYNAALNAKLEGGTAGDLITCRPFDGSLDLYSKGYLKNLQGMATLDNFPDSAKGAWSTDDGSATFCVPMAAVIHGFIYNKDAFAEVGVEPPKTQAEFIAVLDKFKEDGNYIPMAMGTLDQWESAAMGYQNIGPMYWKGEEGRKAVVAGTGKLTDDGWVKPFEVLASWGPYLGDGYEAQSYPDSQTLFTLGRAAIYPSGSWEIAGFNRDSDFELGAFRPPLPAEGDSCYISDHTDIGIGLNAASPNSEAAMKFLEWMGTKEFAELYSNAVPGFFSLSKHEISLTDPLADEFISWRKDCQSTNRSAAQIVSRGTPNLWNEMWVVSANVINGKQTPADAANQLQKGLSAWYEPQMD
ncbi:Multiple sugar-binding protein precursor [Pseudovibrio sp. Ad46]|uniref:ABC transporter substrate-binding protein n=1 Tax=Pseudovibrio sp. Ad46 TaxID=989432 RepID=UPI0007AEDBFE|nr:ABC transporter substrate-binding protein [Pseudovibrio sp. Ad46]KZK94651.1 Multiple sugar-binding protein precursor [Pseudovibrio sp. Ad46]